jgi:5-formyltetrahydrofolate cyclo-ligase
MERQSLRNTIRAQRKQLTSKKQLLASQQLAKNFSKEFLFQQSKHIAFYIAHEGEIDSHFLLQIAIQENKKCYLPILDPNQKNLLCFLHYSFGDILIPNRFKIPEPSFSTTKIIQPCELDLVFLPVVAFDQKGNRLGMGAGFYDKTFEFLLHRKKNHKPKLIGLAYEFQEIENLEPRDWDVKLDGIVTEKKFVSFD